MPPFSKRRLLALYLDFLLFSAIFTPTAWLIERTGGPEAGLAIEVVVFALARVGMLRTLGTSPGRWSLGITREGDSCVDAAITARERWWTMLAGTLLVLEGSKNLVRWTQGLPPPPFLGQIASESATVALVCVLGLLNVAAGLQILRTNSFGAFLGAGVVALETTGTLLNRQAFRDWASHSVTTRRALQGLPVREGRIEFMQDFASLYMPFFMGMGMLLLVAVAVRLWRPSTT